MFIRKFRSQKHRTRDLWRKGDRLVKKGDTEKAVELLLAAAESPSPIDRHYAYVRLIRLYSQLAREGTGDTDRLVELCKKDIDLFPEFYEAWMVEYMNNVPTPYFPSFSVLADIYEQRGMLAEAASLCELALGYGLTETTGEDFPSRLERFHTRIDKKLT